jgi:acetyl-CoA carboxylase biotin carboxyl carrier protein
MARSPLGELEITEGDFHVHLVRTAQGVAPVQSEAPSAAGFVVSAATYGVVHLSPAPDAAPFVQVGQHVEVGQSLCVIEAMKVFSPIEAERAGTIVAILATDGADVTAGQPLFRLE